MHATLAVNAAVVLGIAVSPAASQATTSHHWTACSGSFIPGAKPPANWYIFDTIRVRMADLHGPDACHDGRYVAKAASAAYARNGHLVARPAKYVHCRYKSGRIITHATCEIYNNSDLVQFSVRVAA